MQPPGMGMAPPAYDPSVAGTMPMATAPQDMNQPPSTAGAPAAGGGDDDFEERLRRLKAVSYTHLTLPTILRV